MAADAREVIDTRTEGQYGRWPQGCDLFISRLSPATIRRACPVPKWLAGPDDATGYFAMLSASTIKTE
jgi:hypothetical protein